MNSIVTSTAAIAILFGYILTANLSAVQEQNS